MVNGLKIRQLRESSGYTALELATKVGISQPVMSCIENGIKQPSVATLKRIADVFGTTMDDLVKGKEIA